MKKLSYTEQLNHWKAFKFNCNKLKYIPKAIKSCIEQTKAVCTTCGRPVS